MTVVIRKVLPEEVEELKENQKEMTEKMSKMQQVIDHIEDDIYEEEGSFLTFSPYLIVYAMQIISPIINITNLSTIPLVKSIPAVLDAITVENGLTVDAIVPIQDPK